MRQYDSFKYLDFRSMCEHDLERVLHIERDAYQFPWSEKIFLDCVNSNYQCTLVLMYNRIVGYFIVSKVLDEAHLLNICIEKTWQHQGLGRAVLENLFAELSEQKIARVFLEVRPSNLVALSLYHQLGFEAIGIRKAYYPAEGGSEDAIAMLLSLCASH